MQISKEAFDLIAEAAAHAYDREIGGIIGTDDTRKTICKVFVDDAPSVSRFKYIPNVDLLNEILSQWGEGFMGMFHSHLNNQKNLSHGDKVYIKEIMRAIPTAVFLHFPLYVMPENRLYGYKSVRTSKGEISITSDPVNII